MPVTLTSTRSRLAAAALTTITTLTGLALSSGAHAAAVDVTVKIENLAPANSISFAPLHIGFNNGTFDAFNLGAAPGAAIISVAEGGAGGAWQTAFGAADPGALRSTLGGLLQPGQMFTSASFRIDTALNPFFTFASMAVPSNDFFIGNDSPTAYRLFDAAGNLVLNTINQKASQIWDGGSEIFDPAAAAFVGNNSLRTAQNGVVNFNFAELSGFNGLTTGAGYVFNSQLSAGSDIYRITFTAAPVPEPQTYALMLAGLAAMGAVVRRRATARRNEQLTAA